MDARHGVIVVGGGAAGMVAAIAAARLGAAVTVLERLPRVGKKLLATGNGRCNLANARLSLERYHGGDPGFPRAAFEVFGLEATLGFFAGLGVAAREEEGGKIFPRSGQASSVLDLLRHELTHRGVETRCEAPVARLARGSAGWEVAVPGETLRCAAVVLASGGRASPQLGSNGSGYDLARAIGHRVVEPFPALTRIRASSPFLRHLKGVKVEASATLVDPGAEPRRGGRPLEGAGACASGEVLFTETGLSGPPILDLSRRAGERALRREPTLVRLDLCPEIGAEALAATLRRRFAGRPGVSAALALVGFVHKRLIVPVFASAGVPDAHARAADSLGEPGLRAAAAALKGWDFDVTGTDSWTDAQVTAGGVGVDGVDPATLESRLAPGLFFAGEVLDVDGDCGGFNLQWAWSSGHVAGTGAGVRARETPLPPFGKGGGAGAGG